MTDFIEQIAAELSDRVCDAAIAKFETRLAEIEPEQKFFWTVPEVAALFGCAKSTVRRRLKDGSLGYTRNLANETVVLRRHIDDYFARLEVRVGRANNILELKKRTA